MQVRSIRRTVAIAVSSTLAASQAGATPLQWAVPDPGVLNDPINWLPDATPTADDHASIVFSGAVTLHDQRADGGDIGRERSRSTRRQGRSQSTAR